MTIENITLADKFLDTFTKINANFSELVSRLDAVGTSASWVTVSAAGGGTFKYCKKNGVVFVILVNVSCSTSSWLNLGTLPAGFRPNTDNVRESIAYNGGGSANGEVWVDVDGKIQTFGTIASPWVGQVVFPV